jgi:hypothetical protein
MSARLRRASRVVTPMLSSVAVDLRTEGTQSRFSDRRCANSTRACKVPWIARLCFGLCGNAPMQEAATKSLWRLRCSTEPRIGPPLRRSAVVPAANEKSVASGRCRQPVEVVDTCPQRRGPPNPRGYAARSPRPLPSPPTTRPSIPNAFAVVVTRREPVWESVDRYQRRVRCPTRGLELRLTDNGIAVDSSEVGAASTSTLRAIG